MKIVLPNEKIIDVQNGLSANEILRQFFQRGLKGALAAKYNDVIVDLNRPLNEDGKLEILDFSGEEGREIYWHSSSHLMAQAVKELYPSVKLAIGPPINDGFYYDIDLDETLKVEDLPKIEDKMRELSQQKLIIEREELSRYEAIKMYSDMGDIYKVEILEGLENEENVSFYRQGDFVDMCRGPHLSDTGKIKHFKLLSVAGAYWRGDEKNKMLQRIYGTSYPKKSGLDEHLRLLEEAQKRDHRKVGRELELFSINEEIGSGLILWHPKGSLVRHLIEQFWKDEHLKAGYDFLYSPHIAKLDLWKTSGHVDYYKDSMYAPMKIDDVEYELKPMNCPFHISVYKHRIRSYRELPIYWGELGTVYRYERSGVLHGMLRVRGFTQDDAHIFCLPDQILNEILNLLDFTMFFLKTFGFEEYKIFLSTRPEKSVGTDESWELATNALEEALEIRKLDYEIDHGEGVFYGPKIDIKIKDVLKRYWQCTTIQVDFNNPERFEMEYVGEDGGKHRPIMIHRALLGSLERFFGILIEQYAGAFPVWLAPVQAVVLPITEKHQEFALDYFKKLKSSGLRVQLDDRNEKVGFKIREGETQKIPYMLVIGDKEINDKVIAVRRRREGDIGQMSLDEFISLIQKEIEEKSLLT